MFMACRLSIGFTDCLMFSRNEARTVSDIEGRRAIENASSVHLSGKQADDVRLLLSGIGGIYVPHHAPPSELLRLLRDAVAGGRIVVVSSRRERLYSGGSAEQPPRHRHATVTPSQLFGRARASSSSSYFERAPRTWGKLAAEDGPAIFRANPGDVLPDGRIATAIRSRNSESHGGTDWLSAAQQALGVVVGGGGTLALGFDGNASPSGDAPFEYADDSSFLDSALQLAGHRGVSEADEADCFSAYENDLDRCQFVRAMTQDLRAYAKCTSDAFFNYQTCRGF